MRFSVLFVVLSVLALAGCVTPRDQVAVVRAAEFAKDAGGPLGEAIHQELVQVAVNIGALKVDSQGGIIPGTVDPATVEVTVEASTANAAGIAGDRAARDKVRGFFGNLSKELLDRLPWGGPVLAGLGVALALLRKLKGARSAVNGLVQAGMEIRQQAKDGLPLSEAAIKGVLAFWSRASGSQAEVETALANVKPLWQPAPDGGKVPVDATP